MQILNLHQIYCNGKYIASFIFDEAYLAIFSIVYSGGALARAGNQEFMFNWYGV
jgi:hypothetical protein